MSLANEALKAYRGALRATSIAFQGDLATLQAARAQIRSKMVLNVDPDMPEKSVEDRIKHLDQVSLFLRRNIVQGKKEEEDDKYFLNIHNDTELGDNDDIKKKKRSTFGGQMAAGGGCCGGGEIKMSERRS